MVDTSSTWKKGQNSLYPSVRFFWVGEGDARLTLSSKEFIPFLKKSQIALLLLRWIPLKYLLDTSPKIADGRIHRVFLACTPYLRDAATQAAYLGSVEARNLFSRCDVLQTVAPTALQPNEEASGNTEEKETCAISWIGNSFDLGRFRTRSCIKPGLITLSEWRVKTLCPMGVVNRRSSNAERSS